LYFCGLGGWWKPTCTRVLLCCSRVWPRCVARSALLLVLMSYTSPHGYETTPLSAGAGITLACITHCFGLSRLDCAWGGGAVATDAARVLRHNGVRVHVPAGVARRRPGRGLCTLPDHLDRHVDSCCASVPLYVAGLSNTKLSSGILCALSSRGPCFTDLLWRFTSGGCMFELIPVSRSCPAAQVLTT
jgi:hypothetical protein